MLQAIRSRAASWVVRVMFLLLIISFGAWGITGYLQQIQGPAEVASVGGVVITPQDASNALNAELQRLRQMFGRPIDRQQAKALGVTDQVIDGLVNRALMEDEARRVGITISDEAERRSIEADRTFFGPSGQFDRTRFQALLQQAGYTEGRYVGELRHDLARAQLLRPLDSLVPVPDVLTETLLRYRGERRIAQVATIPLDAMPEPPQPTDAQIDDYYKANGAKYMAPERRDLSFVLIDADALAPAQAVTDAELHQAYEARQAEFVTPEKRTVQQALFNDEAAAKAARAKIDAGEDFAAVAKAATGATDDQISLGAVTEHELPPELGAPVFAAAAGSVVGPIKTAFGWHLLRVAKVDPSVTRAFDEVKTQLTADAQKDKAKTAVYDLSNQLDDALAAGTPLDEAAKQINQKLVKVAGIDRSGNAADGKRPADLPAKPQLVQRAFELSQGQTSPLIELGPDSYAAVRADAVTPAAQRPLAEVHDQAVADWKTAEREKAAKAAADKLVAALKAGTAFDQALPPGVKPPETTAPFSREGEGATLPASVVSALFAGPIGAVASGDGTGGVVVAKLTEIKAVDPATAGPQRESLKGELKSALGGDLLSAYQSALRQRYPVSVNRKALDTIM